MHKHNIFFSVFHNLLQGNSFEQIGFSMKIISSKIYTKDCNGGAAMIKIYMEFKLWCCPSLYEGVALLD